jgi:hypothetical protein
VARVAVVSDASQKGSELDHAAAFGPIGMHGAQVHAEYLRVGAGGLDLEKCTLELARVLPFVVRDLDAARERERVAAARRPVRKLGVVCDLFYYPCVRRFLKDNEVGCARLHNRADQFLAALSAEADVVAH